MPPPCLVFVVLGFEPRAMGMLGKRSVNGVPITAQKNMISTCVFPNFNPSTREAEADRPEFEASLVYIYIEFQASQGNGMRSCLKNKIIRRVNLLYIRMRQWITVLSCEESLFPRVKAVSGAQTNSSDPRILGCGGDSPR